MKYYFLHAITDDEFIIKTVETHIIKRESSVRSGYLAFLANMMAGTSHQILNNKLVLHVIDAKNNKVVFIGNPGVVRDEMRKWHCIKDSK